jgi:hypothetical protein
MHKIYIPFQNKKKWLKIMTVITENLYAMENIVQQKFKKSEKKKAQPIYNPPEKSLEEKELEIKLLDLIAKRRLKNHMQHEKWRNISLIGVYGL